MGKRLLRQTYEEKWPQDDGSVVVVRGYRVAKDVVLKFTDGASALVTGSVEDGQGHIMVVGEELEDGWIDCLALLHVEMEFVGLDPMDFRI